MLNVVSWIVLSMAILTATGLLFSQDWRWTLGLLAVQYFCVFWMVQTHWRATQCPCRDWPGKNRAARTVIPRLRRRDGVGGLLRTVIADC